MLKRATSLLLCLILVASFIPISFATPVKSEIQNHWAKQQLEKWISQGLLTGYADGSFKPDGEMTRAEFVQIVNNLFGFTEESDNTFTDVDPKKWYARPIAIAKSANYISGFPDGSFRPNQAITREQVAYILADLFYLPDVEEKTLSNFLDMNRVSDYAKDAFIRLIGNGYLQGYPDQTIRPQQEVTRAEVVALLDKIVPQIIKKNGVYTGLNSIGNMLVNTDDVTLRDTSINGNLYLTAGVHEGAVTLEQVEIKGTLFINGGGVNSIYLSDSTVDQIKINKKNTPVRLVLTKNSKVKQLDVETKAIVVVSEGTTVDALTILSGAPGTSITGNGTIKLINNQADGTTFNGRQLVKGLLNQPSSTHENLQTNSGGRNPGNGNGEPSNQDQWTLVWSDEFDRSGRNLDVNGVDLDKWDYQLGTGAQYGLDSWGNNEQQYYRAENALVQDGKLIILAKNDGFGGKPYTSARLYTKPTFTKKYGKFEARIKMPAGQGLWPAFWMMPANNVYGEWASSGEIDIMEARGRLPDQVGGTIHYGSKWPNNKYTGSTYYFTDESDITAFHVYSLEWEPGELRWYVDGVLYQTLNNWDSIGENQPAKYAYPAPFDQEFYMILNLAIGGNYDGGRVPDNSMFPAAMEVDYVRVYELTGRAYRKAVEPIIEVEDLPEEIKAPIDGNYIYDPTFNEGFTEVTESDVELNPLYWNFVHLNTFQGDGVVSVEEISGSKFAKVDITAGGNATHAVQLIQNVTLGKGRWYKLTFDAKSTTERTINVKFGAGADRNWINYSNPLEISLTSNVKTYETTFQMTNETDPLARLEFNMGTNTNSVWIGNVRLVETEMPDLYPDTAKEPINGNHVYNGTFDLGRMDRMTYWNFLADEAQAKASVDETTRELKVSILTNSSSASEVQLQQPGINLLKNNEYKLTFRARADKERTIAVVLQDKNGVKNYSQVQNIKLTETMEEKTMTFTMNDPSDVEGLLTFMLGGQKGDLFIDDVVLIRTTNNIDLSGINVFPLNNGDFSFGLDSWKTYAIEGGAATFTEENGEAKISIANVADQSWKVMLNQENMRFSNGVTYVLSFDARASVPRTIEAVIDDVRYNRVVNAQVELTKTMKTYTYEFTMSKDDTLSLKFLMGKINGSETLGAHDIFIDNVILEMKDAPIQRPPQLKADQKRNLVGSPLEITFNDNETWRSALRSVSVNGEILRVDQYDLAAGKLTLAAEVFQSPGDYTIVVAATGFADAKVTDTIFPDDGNGNLVTNGTFDTNITGWQLYIGDGSDATVTYDTYGGGVMKIGFTNYDGWFIWSTQVYQDQIPLETGKTYELSFDAIATETKEIVVSVENALDYNVKYLEGQKVNVDTTMQTFRFVFTVGSTDKNAKLVFQLGSNNASGPHYAGQSIYLDNITLRPISN
ncbi:carbohydrate binding domain-containing protein [Thermicanus aegyptius]|uniref:carbohydrate binding domain-containing protein n=1 Tax=Thermicanus aegyptius TaxID=94009 RepID=UPI000414C379|nr:carbohydrate binding domain-containing protein [Thermicanus aegyptius]